MKCLEGLYLSCQDLIEITKASQQSSNSSNSSNTIPINEKIYLLQSIETMGRVNDLYLFVINLLTIVQDPSLLESIATEMVITPIWFKERPETKVRQRKHVIDSLESLLITILTILR